MYEVFDLHLNILNLNLALFPWPFSKITTLSSELAAHLDIKYKFLHEIFQIDEIYVEIERLRIEHFSEMPFSVGIKYHFVQYVRSGSTLDLFQCIKSIKIMFRNIRHKNILRHPSYVEFDFKNFQK